MVPGSRDLVLKQGSVPIKCKQFLKNLADNCVYTHVVIMSEIDGPLGQGLVLGWGFLSDIVKMHF